MFSFAKFGNELYSGERSFNFIGRRRLWYMIAVLLTLLSLAALGIRGLNPGIEFEGGSEFRVSKVADQSDITGARAVGEVVSGAQPRVTAIGSDGVRVELSDISSDQIPGVREALAEAYRVPVENVTSSYIGPSWGRDVSKKAAQGLVVFLILVSLVIAVYFRTWKMAVAAIVALLHDLVLTVGVYALVGFEVTPASVIGFLTILGYSLYDTVVVFDKVRENTEHIGSTTKRTFAEAANLAVNQTLVRSINTSVVALLPVASILFIGSFLLGAGTLKDISLALFIGIAAGTYSSVFIATPLYSHLREAEPEIKAQAERVRRVQSQGQKAAAGRTPVRVGGSAGSAEATAVGDTPAATSSSRKPSAGAQKPAGGQNRNQPKKSTAARKKSKKRR